MIEIADILDGLDLFTGFSYPDLKLVGRYLARVTKKRDEVISTKAILEPTC